MKTNDYIEEAGLNANDFLGNYLKKEDLSGETIASLVGVQADRLRNEKRNKLVAQFAEFSKPLILNKTNIKRLARMFGSANTALWKGPITLYVDEGVEFGGDVVGGIRVKAATPNGAAARDREMIGTAHKGERDIL